MLIFSQYNSERRDNGRYPKEEAKKKCLFAFLLHFDDFYQLHYFIVVAIILIIQNSFFGIYALISISE